MKRKRTTSDDRRYPPLITVRHYCRFAILPIKMSAPGDVHPARRRHAIIAADAVIIAHAVELIISFASERQVRLAGCC